MNETGSGGLAAVSWGISEWVVEALLVIVVVAMIWAAAKMLLAGSKV